MSRTRRFDPEQYDAPNVMAAEITLGEPDKHRPVMIEWAYLLLDASSGNGLPNLPGLTQRPTKRLHKTHQYLKEISAMNQSKKTDHASRAIGEGESIFTPWRRLRRPSPKRMDTLSYA